MLALVFVSAAVAGIAYLLMGVWIYGRSYLRGWPSTIVVILTCAAAILGCLGILGICISRIFEATRGRPLYLRPEGH